MKLYIDKDYKVYTKIEDYNPFEYVSLAKLSDIAVHKSLDRNSVLSSLWLSKLQKEAPKIEHEGLLFYDTTDILIKSIDKNQLWLNLFLLIDQRTELSFFNFYLELFRNIFLGHFMPCIITNRASSKLYGRAFVWRENLNFILDLKFMRLTDALKLMRHFFAGYTIFFRWLETNKFHFLQDENVAQDKIAFEELLQIIDIEEDKKFL